MKTPNLTGGYLMYGLLFLLLMMTTTACSVNNQYHKGKLVWKDNFNHKNILIPATGAKFPAEQQTGTAI